MDGNLVRVPRRIAFISPTGFGNLGDAAILDSLIHGVRQRIPDAEIVGFTQNPRDTRERYGIPAFTCSGVSTSHYNIVEPPPAPSTPPSEGGGRPRRQNPLKRLSRIMVRESRVAHGAWQIARERRHRKASIERIRGFDFVVVAGGGQLDDFWGGPFGHPYTLMRWGDLARQAGAKFVVLSVGTGSLKQALSARFVRRALSRASYRSFRDARSRELVGDPLVANDPVVPDLAYGLAFERVSTRGVIGVSPMAYADPRGWPAPDRARYEAHVGSFASLTAKIARAGHQVVLFTTDGQDKSPLGDMRARIESELDEESKKRISAPEIDGVASLMRVLGGCEVVIAARLHGVILSHVAGRPTLAISHERKVKTVMEGMDLSRWCCEIEGFTVDEGWSRFAELYEKRARIAADVQARVAAYRKEVDAQYDRVFG